MHKTSWVYEIAIRISLVLVDHDSHIHESASWLSPRIGGNRLQHSEANLLLVSPCVSVDMLRFYCPSQARLLRWC
jgi:hypothetical protein